MINANLLADFPRGNVLDRLIVAKFNQFSDTELYATLPASEKGQINDVYEFCRSPHFARIADICREDALIAAAVIGGSLPGTREAIQASLDMGQCLVAAALPLAYLDHHIRLITEQYESPQTARSDAGDTTARASIRATDKWKNADKL